MRRRELLKALPLLMAPAVARAETRPLRFIPNANLSAIDPIWTIALAGALRIVGVRGRDPAADGRHGAK